MEVNRQILASDTFVTNMVLCEGIPIQKYYSNLSEYLLAQFRLIDKGVTELLWITIICSVLVSSAQWFEGLPNRGHNSKQCMLAVSRKPHFNDTVCHCVGCWLESRTWLQNLEVLEMYLFLPVCLLLVPQFLGHFFSLTQMQSTIIQDALCSIPLYNKIVCYHFTNKQKIWNPSFIRKYS